LKRGGRATASFSSLDVPLFSVLMSVRTPGFFFKGEGGKWNNKTTRKQKKTKRTSVSDKVLTARLRGVLQTAVEG